MSYGDLCTTKTLRSKHVEVGQVALYYLNQDIGTITVRRISQKQSKLLQHYIVTRTNLKKKKEDA